MRRSTDHQQVLAAAVTKPMARWARSAVADAAGMMPSRCRRLPLWRRCGLTHRWRMCSAGAAGWCSTCAWARTLRRLLAGSSSFDTQGQIYELQCRIEQLMLPMAQSQAGYIANMLRTAENAAARSGTGEQTPIRRLKLQQAQRVVENQQRELTDMLALCQTKTSGKPAARAY